MNRPTSTSDLSPKQGTLAIQQPEPLPHPTPRAIENGANALAEGFLFGVAALIIIGETWRSSRSQSKRRDDVNDKLEDLSTRIHELSSRLDQSLAGVEDRLEYERQRYRVFDPLSFCVG